MSPKMNYKKGLRGYDKPVTIGGKRFHPRFSAKKKKDALKLAKDIRKDGRTARIIKDHPIHPGYWVVFVGAKKK